MRPPLHRYWNTLPQFISHVGKVTNTDAAKDGSTKICLAEDGNASGGIYADPLANLGAAIGAASAASISVGAAAGAVLLCMLLL